MRFTKNLLVHNICCLTRCTVSSMSTIPIAHISPTFLGFGFLQSLTTFTYIVKAIFFAISIVQID
ncbi:hypothetical protein Hanom_Chr15g01342571 [Helianthus anomalus]